MAGVRDSHGTIKTQIKALIGAKENLIFQNGHFTNRGGTQTITSYFILIIGVYIVYLFSKHIHGSKVNMVSAVNRFIFESWSSLITG